MLMRFIEYLLSFVYFLCGREPPRRHTAPKSRCWQPPSVWGTVFNCVDALGLSDFQLSLQYAPRNQEIGPQFCELSVNNKRASPNKVQAGSLRNDIGCDRILYY